MTTDKAVMIRCEGLNKSYPIPGKERSKRQILHDISLQIQAGELISVVGPSGSGKSTLLYCLSGLESIDSGRIILCGTDITELSLPEISRIRRENVGFVFQDLNLIQSLNAIENTMLPRQLAGMDADYDEAQALLEKLGLSEHISALPNTLSGGEQQRIAVARILYSHSKIVFADEPTGALDSRTSRVVAGLLRATAIAGSAVMIVTHDIELAAQSDRVLVLYDGKIHATLRHPTSRQVFDMLDGLNQRTDSEL